MVKNPKCLVCVVSKSGETLEIKTWIRELYPHVDASRWLVVTDPEKGSLRQWAKKEGLQSLPIPSEIGGRFTHFSTFHRALLESQGFNFQELLGEAKKLCEALQKNPQELEEIYQKFYASDRVQKLVLWGYGSLGFEFAAWAQQALAESLGKKQNGKRFGKSILLLRGPQDQHSVLQHLIDGPQDHGIWFFEAEGEKIHSASKEEKLPEWLKDLQNFSCLQAQSLLCEATYLAFEERLQNPETSQALERWKITPSLLGMTRAIVKLQAFVEYAGDKMQINAFDQPGVERGKEIARQLMKA
jgi:glucose-6-phosphate isomerase